MGERWQLLYNFVPHGQREFKSAADLEAAWRRHGAALTATLPPFQRPDFFWWHEAKQAPPDTLAGGRETSRAALLRLGLPLTPREERIFGGEVAFRITEQNVESRDGRRSALIKPASAMATSATFGSVEIYRI